MLRERQRVDEKVVVIAVSTAPADVTTERPGTPGSRTVCLVIASLRAGGAERVMMMLAEGLSARGWDVVVITLDTAASDFYPVPAGVRRQALGVMKPSRSLFEAARSNLQRVLVLRRAICQECPTMSITFVDQTNVLTLLATVGLPFPMIVSERIDPRAHDPGLMWRVLRRLTYRRASSIVMQTPGVVPWARSIAGNADVAVIPNPVAVSDTGATPLARKQRIVGVGRLVAHKGFDVLIDAFARIALHHPDWELMIVGDGPLLGDLRTRVANAGLAGRVTFTGNRTDVHHLVSESEIFVLSSRYEGFPNVLVEAMSLGCAVIASACPSGPTDIVSDGVDGILVAVEDVAALASQLHRLITSPNERAALQRNAPAVRARYAPDLVINQWEQLIHTHAPVNS